jgi:ribosomal protein S18 acetylase RimI-like enzyme
VTRLNPHPRRLAPDDPALPAVLALVCAEFAYMDGRIDPPSSIHALTLPALTEAAVLSEVWAIADPPVACVILTPRPPVLYLGKLAVAAPLRGAGLARALVDLACKRAAALGLASVELSVRTELVANHAAFVSLGFVEMSRTAHTGFDRPTAIVYQRSVA